MKDEAVRPIASRPSALRQQAEALLRTSAQDLAVLSVTDLQRVVRCSWLAAAEGEEPDS